MKNKKELPNELIEIAVAVLIRPIGLEIEQNGFLRLYQCYMKLNTKKVRQSCLLHKMT